MSPMSKPSKVDALKRGVGTAAPKADGHDVSPLQPAQAPPRRPPKEPTTRFTLDLDRDHHQFLKQFALEAEVRGAAEVMRALLDELREDPALADRIRARVWEGKR